jgi:hypothetical protein
MFLGCYMDRYGKGAAEDCENDQEVGADAQVGG